MANFMENVMKAWIKLVLLLTNVLHGSNQHVTSALSLSTFRRHLKTYLFRCCYNTDSYCSYSHYSGPRGGVAA